MQQYIGHAPRDTRYSKRSDGQEIIAFLTTSKTGFQYAGSTKSDYVTDDRKGYKYSSTNYVDIPHGKGVITDENGNKYACRYNNGELVWLAEKEKYDARSKCYGVKKLFCIKTNDTADKVRILEKYNGKNHNMQNFHDAIAAIAPKNTTIQSENSYIKKGIYLQNKPRLEENHINRHWNKLFENMVFANSEVEMKEMKEMNEMKEAKRNEKAAGKVPNYSLGHKTMSQLNKLGNEVPMSQLSKLENKVHNSFELKMISGLNAAHVKHCV